MPEFYLLRHGQTLFNLEEKVQGYNDSPLTDTGILQARQAGYGAREILFTAAYSGTAQRQSDTAELFLSENLHPIPVQKDFHFSEACFGKYEGGTYYDMLNPLYEDLKESYAGYDGLYRFYNDMQIAARLEEKDETGGFEGGEKTFRRFIEGLNLLSKRYEEEKILISTSSYAICTLLDHLFPDLVQNSLVDHASLTIIRQENSDYSLIAYNDTSCRKTGEKNMKK